GTRQTAQWRPAPASRDEPARHGAGRAAAVDRRHDFQKARQNMAIVITAAGRSPLGALQGSLAPLPAPDLAAQVVKELVGRIGVTGTDIDHALIGNVLSAGQGQAPARQVTIKAGLGDSVPAVTLNKMCGSGLETVIQASRLIGSGE